MRYKEMTEGLARLRDKAYDRFWWSGGDFEWIGDSTHADWVVGYYSDLSDGSYDDPINEIGETEEEVTSYYIDANKAVRGGIMKDPKGSHAFLEGNSLRSVQRCLKDLLEEDPSIAVVALEVGRVNTILDGEELELFIRRGRVRS